MVKARGSGLTFATGEMHREDGKLPDYCAIVRSGCICGYSTVLDRRWFRVRRAHAATCLPTAAMWSGNTPVEV